MTPSFKITAVDTTRDTATVEFYSGATKIRTETICTRGFDAEGLTAECWRLAEAYCEEASAEKAAAPDFSGLVGKKVESAPEPVAQGE